MGLFSFRKKARTLLNAGDSPRHQQSPNEQYASTSGFTRIPEASEKQHYPTSTSSPPLGKTKSWFRPRKQIDSEVGNIPLLPLGYKQGNNAPVSDQRATQERPKSVFVDGRHIDPTLSALPELPVSNAAATKSERTSEQDVRRRTVSRVKSSEKISRRLSWLIGKPDAETDVPPVPNIPASHQGQRRWSKAPVPNRTKTSNEAKRISRSAHAKSWIATSSNPDYDSEVPDWTASAPPVPDLAYSSGSTSSDTSSSVPSDHDHHRFSRHGRKQRPMSCAASLYGDVHGRKIPYKPRNAAKSFIRSTTLAPEEVRRSYRRSVCMTTARSGYPESIVLNQEQLVEWDRLRELIAQDEAREGEFLRATKASEVEVDEIGRSSREGLFSHGAALAALENGPPR